MPNRDPQKVMCPISGPWESEFNESSWEEQIMVIGKDWVAPVAASPSAAGDTLRGGREECWASQYTLYSRGLENESCQKICFFRETTFYVSSKLSIIVIIFIENLLNMLNLPNQYAVGS